MLEDEERTWKQKAEARAVEDFSQLWGRCAWAGFLAILLAPIALVIVVWTAETLRRGYSPLNVTAGRFFAGMFQFYGMALLFSLAASIPCAIVYAIAAYKLRVAGTLNWFTSALVGALIGILASILVNVTIMAGKAPRVIDFHEFVLFAPASALTTLMAYLLCLRRV